MTTEALKQLHYLNPEVSRIEKQIEFWQTERVPPAAREAVAELLDALQDSLRLRKAERDVLEQFIADIPDSYTRRIFRLRFSDGLSWDRISVVEGGCATPDCFKKMVYRYLKKTNQ